MRLVISVVAMISRRRRWRRISFSNFQAGATFKKINKTGTCDYSISFTNRNPAIDVLTGNRVTLGGSTADLLSDYNAVNYAADEDDSVQTHLSGIDAAIAELKAAHLPKINVNVSSFGEGGAAFALNVETTNGYYMGSVALNMRYKKTSDGAWTDIAPQTFTDGTLSYSFVALSIDDGEDYDLQGYLTDSNAPNLAVQSEVSNFNHAPG